MNPFLRVIDALNRENVRYVIVGGFAAVMHGVPRVTGDLDLIIDLDQLQAEKALKCLLSLGLETHLPVNPLQFANLEHRQEWIQNKQMKVFSLYDPQPTGPTIDLFVQHPLPFEELYAHSTLTSIKGLSARICSIDDLIALKQISGRPIDLDDIQQLRAIQSLGSRKTDE